MSVRDESGQVGGIEVLPFGILTFVIAMLVIANAWGAIDADLSTTSAARDAVRSFVEAPDEATAQQRAVEAAMNAIDGHGRSTANTSISISYAGSQGWARCSRVTVTVHHPIPAIRVPIIGGFGHGFDVVASESEVIDPYRSGIQGSVAC